MTRRFRQRTLIIDTHYVLSLPSNPDLDIELDAEAEAEVEEFLAAREREADVLDLTDDSDEVNFPQYQIQAYLLARLPDHAS